MDPTPFLAFVPLLMYGMGLTALMSEWKRVIHTDQMYLPYTLMAVVLSEVAVYNLYIYIRLIAELKDQSYLSYLTYLISPAIFFVTTNVFTPDKESDTEEYFISRMRLFYILFALLVASHFIFSISETHNADLIRLGYIAVLLTVAWLRKVWLTYVVVVCWALSFLVRAGVQVL